MVFAEPRVAWAVDPVSMMLIMVDDFLVSYPRTLLLLLFFHCSNEI
jgi:hypothetical protein